MSTIQTKNLLGATMIVTGSCIGAGMIGLPVLSALTGFIPSALAMLLCYLFTTLTGLLLLEATLWFEDKVNLPSIVEFTLGKYSKFLTLICFMSLFYCLFVAYFDGCGILFAGLLESILGYPVSHTFGMTTCLLFVGSCTYAGAKLVDNANRLLILGLLMTYLILIFIGLPNVDQHNLTQSHWKAIFSVIPILLICFGYQNLVPTITYYLKKNVKAIRFAIVVGNLIPFFVYFLWNYVIIGMLSLLQNNHLGESQLVEQLLQHASPNLSVLVYIKAFSLFAMLTSFLPGAISFVDFIKDSAKSTFLADQAYEPLIYGLVFIPPYLCAILYPHIFLNALNFAGGFIDVILFGIIPASVVLVGRNIKKLSGPYQVLGGNVTPFLVLVFSMTVLYLKLN